MNITNLLFPTMNISLGSILISIIAFVLLWIIISIPVYFAAKLLVGSRAGFLSAMLASLAGPIVFAIVYGLGFFVLGSFLPGLGLVAIILAFLAWIWVYKTAFSTGWIMAFGIAILAIIVAILIAGLFALFGFVVIGVTHLFRYLAFS